MAVRAKIDLKGFGDLLEEIAKLGGDIDAATDRALMAGGEVLLGGMQRRVRKDTHNLEEHLVIEGPVRDGNFHYVEVGLSSKADAETARYGNVNEYGSSSMPAQPYIRPAVEEDRRKVDAAIKESLRSEGVI